MTISESDVIGNGGRAIFYGAGRMAQYSYACHLNKLTPVCFCDRDVKKHGEKIDGINIVSPEETFAKHPDLPIFIATKSPLKFDIIDSLVHDYGISKKRIQNYEPYAKYLSCEFLQHLVVMGGNGLQPCCASMFKHKSPVLSYESTLETSLEKFLFMRENLIYEIKKGNAENTPCAGCSGINERYYASSPQIREINFSFTKFCNFNCAYCNSASRSYKSLSEKEKERLNKFSLSESVLAAKKLGIVNDETVFDLASGELTAQRDCDEILDTLIASGGFIDIFTNAGIFSQKIAHGFDKGQVSILVSIDCGTRETFKKIKGVDLFEKVCENLRKYSDAGVLIKLKYILLNSVNDNDDDIDGFVRLCRKIKPFSVHLTRDLHEGKITESEKQAAISFARKTKEFDVHLSEFDFSDEDLKEIKSSPS